MRNGDTFVRLRAVKEITGLSRSSIYRRIAEGTLPKQINLGDRAVGWLRSEIDQWVTERVANSRPTATTSQFGNLQNPENHPHCAANILVNGSFPHDTARDAEGKQQGDRSSPSNCRVQTDYCEVRDGR